jgi:hypothetical protein
MGEKDRPVEKSIHGPSVEQSQVSTANGDFLLTIRLADADRIGCLLDALEITPLSGSRLLLEPACLARTLAYLEGGLTVVEAERSGKRAILRSAIPRTDNGQIGFTEVVVDARGGLTFARYIYEEATGKRQRTPLPITRETLTRLSEDLAFLLASQV